ncbi:Long-chain-alcohol oxidase FAO4A [Acorus gramineus]|uniref:Long-chain-alcohol oxidase FAO4A n=1 Tax=Acorus gramineus TaxID=55184 RepID=A0AAV9BDI0_ACOGR|nr:Long-chain-alcohol oxidase FAO4A [Acorus gramineus]
MRRATTIAGGRCHLGCKGGRKKGTAETWLADMAESGNGVIFPRCEALRVMHEKGVIKGRRATGVVFKSQKQAHRTEPPPPPGGHGVGVLPVEEEELRGWDHHVHVDGGVQLRDHWVRGGDVLGADALAVRRGLQRQDDTVRGDGAPVRTRAGRTMAYKMDGRDEESLQRGLEEMLRILAAAGAEEIGTQHRTGERLLNVKKAGVEELERFVREASGRGLRDWSAPISSAHQMGSCRMGVEPERGDLGGGGALRG